MNIPVEDSCLDLQHHLVRVKDGSPALQQPQLLQNDV